MYRLNDCKFHNSNFDDAKDGERIAIPEGVSRVLGGILAKQLPKASQDVFSGRSESTRRKVHPPDRLGFGPRAKKPACGK